MRRFAYATSRLVLPACCCLLSQAATAALCLPSGCKGSISQTDQQGIVFFHKGRQELAIRVDYDIRGAEGPVTKLGWIIPVPGPADVTGTVSSKVFGELGEFASPVHRSDNKPPVVRGGELPEEMPRTQPAITSLAAPGKAGIRAVAAWLENNGLEPLPAESIERYAEGRWHFVAVLFQDPQGLPLRGRLTPIRVACPALRIQYPMLLWADRGVFDLTLYIFCKGRIDARELSEFGLSLVEQDDRELKQANRITRIVDLPPAARELCEAVAVDPVLAKLTKERILLYRAHATGLNEAGARIADWQTDLQLSAPLGSAFSPYINLMVGVAAVLAVLVLGRTRRNVARSRAGTHP